MSNAYDTYVDSFPGWKNAIPMSLGKAFREINNDISVVSEDLQVAGLDKGKMLSTIASMRKVSMDELYNALKEKYHYNDVDPDYKYTDEWLALRAELLSPTSASSNRHTTWQDIVLHIKFASSAEDLYNRLAPLYCLDFDMENGILPETDQYATYHDFLGYEIWSKIFALFRECISKEGDC